MPYFGQVPYSFAVPAERATKRSRSIEMSNPQQKKFSAGKAAKPSRPLESSEPAQQKKASLKLPRPPQRLSTLRRWTYFLRRRRPPINVMFSLQSTNSVRHNERHVCTFCGQEKKIGEKILHNGCPLNLTSLAARSHVALIRNLLMR